MTKSGPRSPSTTMRHQTMSFTHLEILTLQTPSLTSTSSELSPANDPSNCFVENMFAFISPFKFKVKTCLFFWDSTAQHYPGLSHGSHCNVKETFVTSIQKIYPLVIFKLNFYLLWYIFSSLVCLLDISNTVKLTKLWTNHSVIWKYIFFLNQRVTRTLESIETRETLNVQNIKYNDFFRGKGKRGECQHNHSTF